MFSDLRPIIDMIRDSTFTFEMYKSRKKRKKLAIDLLATYFLMKDCVEEGKTLICEAGSDPIHTIQAMDEMTAASTLKRWEAVLYRQAVRLRQLQGFVTGQYYLAVLSPEVQERISEIIGYKLNRVNSLHGIGATLFFHSMFPIAKSNEDKARYVSVMAGSESDIINVEKSEKEIISLQDSLEKFRKVVERILSIDEITEFSREARKTTLFEEDWVC